MKDDIQGFVDNFLRTNSSEVCNVIPFVRKGQEYTETPEEIQDRKDINFCIERIGEVADEIEKYFTVTRPDELGFAKWTMALCILSGNAIATIMKCHEDVDSTSIAQRFLDVLSFQINKPR